MARSVVIWRRVDNESEHMKGRAQQAEGNIQKNFGKAEEKIDDKLKRKKTDRTDEARRTTRRSCTMIKPAPGDCAGPAFHIAVATIHRSLLLALFLL